MMGFGLLGAVGGVGKGLLDTAAVMQKDHEMEQKRLTEIELMKMRDQLENSRDVSRDKIGRDTAEWTLKNIRPQEMGLLRENNRLSAQDRIDLETSPDNVQKQIDALKALGPAEAEIKRNAMIEELKAKGTPEAIQAIKAIAQAQHVESAGSRASADKTKLETEALQQIRLLQREYLNPETTPERKEELINHINVLTGKKEDLQRLNVVVGQDDFGKPIMENRLYDPKSKTWIDPPARNTVAPGNATSPPPVPGARMGNDGKWYVQRDGKNYPVIPAAGQQGARQPERPAQNTQQPGLINQRVSGPNLSFMPEFRLKQLAEGGNQNAAKELERRKTLYADSPQQDDAGLLN